MAYQPPLGGEPLPQKPLAWSGVEATYIASLFTQSTLLNGRAATKSALLEVLPTHPLLHFATHGNLSEEVPLLSSILLAEGEALSLYELLGLQLNARLVVLSACETGLGETTGGDDVLGLTRGLLGAGAYAAVVSLWPVDDASTSLLMGYFYQHLRAGDPPMIAMQAAQNGLRSLRPDLIKEELGKLQAGLEKVRPDGAEARLLKAHTTKEPVAPPTPSQDDYRHPFYWAPFILVGGSASE
jgi:CHAT domain-containing protein